MLPAAASFKRQGANKGALASFLVSTPESGVDSIAITYALLDPLMTVIRPLAAFVTGISAGFLENAVSWRKRDKEIPTFSNMSCTNQTEVETTEKKGMKAKIVAGLRYGFIDVWGDIVFWFMGGVLLAGIITVMIPDDFSELVLGGGLISMLAMLVVGMPVYICATASTPIAAALLLKGASPGAVLVFLLAGPATNLTSLSVLIQILGKMGTLRYLLVIGTVSVLFGLGTDMLYNLLHLEPRALVGEAREIMPEWLKLGSAFLLLVLSVWHLRHRYLRKRRLEKYQHLSDFPRFPSDSTGAGAGQPAVTTGKRTGVGSE